jgi:heme A synthase
VSTWEGRSAAVFGDWVVLALLIAYTALGIAVVGCVAAGILTGDGTLIAAGCGIGALGAVASVGTAWSWSKYEQLIVAENRDLRREVEELDAIVEQVHRQQRLRDRRLEELYRP